MLVLCVRVCVCTHVIFFINWRLILNTAHLLLCFLGRYLQHLSKAKCGAGGRRPTPHNTPISSWIITTFCSFWSRGPGPHSAEIPKIKPRAAEGCSSFQLAFYCFKESKYCLTCFWKEGRSEGKKTLSFIIMTTWTTIWLILRLSFKWWQIALLLNTVFINHF